MKSMNNSQCTLNSKTVLMILRSESFSTTVGEIYHFDRFKTKTDKISLQMSLWSCMVEGILEYCRITFDLFSAQKPISLITVDSDEKIHSMWYEEDQNLKSIWRIFSNEISLKKTLDIVNCFRLPGLLSSLNVLQTPTPAQADGSLIGNAGRVLVIGTDIRNKLPCWKKDILEKIKHSKVEEGYLPIDFSEWVFVDLKSKSNETTQDLEQHEISDPQHKFCYVQINPTKHDVYTGFMLMLEEHLNLASSLVQEIPMKEETNATSGSSMYGVELLHEAEAHYLLKKLGLAEKLYIRQKPIERMDTDECVINDIPGAYHKPPSGFSKTLGINWVTPRVADSHIIRYSVAAFRVTMAAVGNRAAVCLAQFVLGGRSVVLAHRVTNAPDDVSSSHTLFTGSMCKTGQEETCSMLSNAPDSVCYHAHTHGEAFLLICHGSVMYIHVLAVSAPMSHPPIFSLSESSLDASNYRLTAFTKNLLYPGRLAPASARPMYALTPKDHALQHIERCTRYCPLTPEATILGNNTVADPLFEHLPKDFLEPAEFSASEQAINLLVSSIRNHPIMKKYTINMEYSQPIAMALELQHLLETYANLSDEHRQLADKINLDFESIHVSSLSTGNKSAINLTTLLENAKHLLKNNLQTTITAKSCEDKPLLRLKSLGRSLAPEYLESKMAGVNGTPSPFKNDTSNLKVTKCSLDKFVQKLNASNKKPMPIRPEFSGVIGGNGKKTIALYGGMSEET